MLKTGKKITPIEQIGMLIMKLISFIARWNSRQKLSVYSTWWLRVERKIWRDKIMI